MQVPHHQGAGSADGQCRGHGKHSPAEVSVEERELDGCDVVFLQALNELDCVSKATYFTQGLAVSVCQCDEDCDSTQQLCSTGFVAFVLGCYT